MTAPKTESPPSAISLIRATARPLMFRTGVQEAPITTWGTCFLVGYKTRFFVLTAAHLIGDAHSGSVLISPSDGSTDWLPLSNGYRLIGHSEEDPSDYDVIAYEVFRKDLPSRVMSKSRILLLESSDVLNWKPTSYVSQFFLFGFPRERSEVDYEAGNVINTQILLAGRYLGMTDMQHTVHGLEVANPLRLSTFAGFSGSPVLSLETRVGARAAVRFCGVAVSGTVESARVHFVESEVIADLLDTVIGHAVTFGHATQPDC